MLNVFLACECQGTAKDTIPLLPVHLFMCTPFVTCCKTALGGYAVVIETHVRAQIVENVFSEKGY